MCVNVSVFEQQQQQQPLIYTFTKTPAEATAATTTATAAAEGEEALSEVLCRGCNEWRQVKRESVCVGDVVRVCCRQSAPADLLLLYSSNSSDSDRDCV